MGGSSSEREISLKSGKAVVDALRQEGYNVIALDVSDNLKQVQNRLEEAHINVAFIALHGRFGEDGTIQKLLESLNIPYTGSGVKASSLALDKIASRKKFKDFGIAVPEYRIVTSDVSVNDDNLHFPLVVKPSSQGSSIGLSIVEDKKDLSKAIKLALSFDEQVIVEEYIYGREITVGILDEEALPVVQIVPKRRFYDYQAKYKKGMSEYLIPAPLSDDEYRKAQEVGLSAHRCLGCRDFSRIDMIIHKGKSVVLEVNTIPGLTSNSLLPKAAEAIGINFNQLCVRLIELATL
jgi:D-alanine-D-alanine ligase